MAELSAIALDLAESEGEARAASFRDRIGGGRKVAIHILEFFDRLGYSRRVGDGHRIFRDTLLWTCGPWGKFIPTPGRF